MVNILYVNGFQGDYLADTLLIGLKSLKNVKVFEFPINNIIYQSSSDHDLLKYTHGSGFTIANVIGSSLKTPYVGQLDIKDFDLIVFSSIHRQYGFLLQILPYLNYNNTAIVDGEDGPPIFPYMGIYWRKPYLWTLPKVHKRFQYFKRELIEEDILFYRSYKIIPKFLCSLMKIPSNIKEISFSIPDTKILRYLPKKEKQFTRHIVDQEVATHVGGQTSYAFKKEQDYYDDIQISKFGVTTKRAGWDCLRHYEIAANGTVICFRDLHKKPSRCAPHGLVPGKNCISYSSWEDLKRQISLITDEEYLYLQQNSLDWAQQNSSSQRAKNLLLSFGHSCKEY